jgi:hypothetical protein
VKNEATAQIGPTFQAKSPLANALPANQRRPRGRKCQAKAPVRKPLPANQSQKSGRALRGGLFILHQRLRLANGRTDGQTPAPPLVGVGKKRRGRPLGGARNSADDQGLIRAGLGSIEREHSDPIDGVFSPLGDGGRS